MFTFFHLSALLSNTGWAAPETGQAIYLVFVLLLYCAPITPLYQSWKLTVAVKKQCSPCQPKVEVDPQDDKHLGLVT